MKYAPRGWKIRPLFYLLLCANLLGSGSFAVQAISPGELIINRLQITGGAGKTENDFVELYNASLGIIDLSGLRLVKQTKNGTADATIKSWTSPLLLNPGAVYLWANSNNGFAASLKADASSTQTLSNDNGLAIRNGGENTGTIIDAVGWGASQNSLFETSPYSQNPGANEILQRKNHQDSNNNQTDFELAAAVLPSVCGNSVMEALEGCDDGNTLDHDGCSGVCTLETPPLACGNNIIEAGEQCDDHNTVAGDGCSDACQTENLVPNGQNPVIPEDPVVYINEFIVDPVAGGNEWIELFSPSETAFSIKDWTLEDGSGTKTKITGNDTIGGANHYFAIPKSIGALNNSGDIIILRDQIGGIIDSVAYGDWDDGNASDNAPTAPDPYAIARIPGATAGGSDLQNYAITSFLTMWGENVIKAPLAGDEAENDTDNGTTEDNYDYAKTIVISEISPNPLGIDEEQREAEFIELYNSGNQVVRLEGWRIEIGDKQYIYQFPAATEINPKTYSVIRAAGNFQLANSGTAVKLFQPLRTSTYQSITYKEAAEGQSWALWHETEGLAGKVWKWTYVPTAAQANIFASPPAASFSVLNIAEAGQSIRFDSSDTDNAGSGSGYNWNFGDGTTSPLPFPEHAYKSGGTYTVVLTVRNTYGSSTVSRKITVNKTSDQQKIALNEKSANSLNSSSDPLTKSPFKLSLNEILPNPEGADKGGEWVEIINDGSEAVNIKNWSVANKNKAGPAINEDITLEPGELFLFRSAFLPAALGNSEDSIRLLDPEGLEASKIAYRAAPEDQSYARINTSWHWSAETTPGETNVLAIPAEKKSAVSTAKKTAAHKQIINGIVMALPGTFSTQYFYLQPENSPLLYQIYNSKKLFPEFKIGQTISVSGEASTTAAGPRLKTAAAEDIRIISQETETPETLPISSLDIKNPPHPRFARIEGEITSKKSPRLIVTDEKGDTEVYLAKGSGLSITAFAVGDKVRIGGIAQKDGTNVRLMPRSEKDIEILNAPAGPETTVTAASIEQDLAANPRNNNKSLLAYIALATAAILGTGGYFIWKFRKNIAALFGSNS